MTEPRCECISFCDLKPGMKCRVAEILGNDPGCGRLLDLGLVPGAEFEVVREAPFGDPIEIRLNGSSLVLRKGEGSQVVVEHQAS